jgi:defect-in-organelle-trafficking protein DotB
MNPKTQTYIFPDEPLRFTPKHLEALLAYCNQLNASDITIQTGEPITVEVYGKLYKITKRKLSNTEVGDLLNNIYGPNGTAQILSGIDVDTHYELMAPVAKSKDILEFN